jgi:serine/threonine-protein kinase
MSQDLLERCFGDPDFKKRYKDVEQIGDGAFSDVLKAFCIPLRDVVAIKVLKVGANTDDIERFRREARNNNKLLTPNVIRTYGFFHEEGVGRVAWIEMEYVDGINLEDELRRRESEQTPFLLSEALELAIAAANALATAHAVDVIHRDVKPANFMLPKGGGLKLGDFGISKHAAASRLTSTGITHGTPIFMSPESVEGLQGKELGPAHDIYSLGMVLYFMFSGNRPPYQLTPGARPAAWYNAHFKLPPTPLRQHVPEIPDELEMLISSMLFKRPEKRPTAAEVVESLKLILEQVVAQGLTGRARSVVKLPRAGFKTSLRRVGEVVASGRSAFLFGGVGVLGIVLVLMFAGRNSAPPKAAAAVPQPPIESPAPEGTHVPATDAPRRVATEAPTGRPAAVVAAGTRVAAAPSAARAETMKAPAQGVGMASIAVVGDDVQLTNGPASLADVELELVSTESKSYKMKYPGVMAPGEEASVDLVGFSPQPPTGVRFLKAVVRMTAPGGKKSQTFPLQH